MRSGFLRTAVAVCLAWLAVDVSAAQEGDTLTFAAAVQRAVRQHPELRGFDFQLQRAAAERDAAGLRPAPQLEFMLEDALGTGPRSGLRSAQSTLSLSQVIELGGKRDLRLGVADAAAAVVRTQRSARQLDVVAEVARRYHAVLEGQLHMGLAREGERLAAEALALVERRVEAARSPPAERSRAHAQWIEAGLAREDVEHELDAARHRLAAAMGETEVRFGLVEGDLLALTPLVPLEQLLARLEATPDILRFADEARLREAEQRLASVQRRPDLRATLGLRRHEQADGVSLVAGVSLPLFAPRQAAPREQAAAAALGLVGTAREVHSLAVGAQLHSQYLELEHARHLTDALRGELIPALEKALEETAYAYERGRYSWLEWSTARRDLLDARMRLVEAAADFHLLRTEIERLTAESLDVSGELP